MDLGAKNGAAYRRSIAVRITTDTMMRHKKMRMHAGWAMDWVFGEIGRGCRWGQETVRYLLRWYLLMNVRRFAGQTRKEHWRATKFIRQTCLSILNIIFDCIRIWVDAFAVYTTTNFFQWLQLSVSKLVVFKFHLPTLRPSITCSLNIDSMWNYLKFASKSSFSSPLAARER